MLLHCYMEFEEQEMRIIRTLWKHNRACLQALKKWIIGRKKKNYLSGPTNYMYMYMYILVLSIVLYLRDSISHCISITGWHTNNNSISWYWRSREISYSYIAIFKNLIRVGVVFVMWFTLFPRAKALLGCRSFHWLGHKMCSESWTVYLCSRGREVYTCI